MKFPIIVVGGSTPREAGQMLGSQLKEPLQEMVDQIKSKAENSYRGGWAVFLNRTKIYSAFVENFLPRDHDEMCGIVEGSGIPIEHLYGLTCLELREEMKGCTDFVVTAKATQDGHVYACHNEDWNAREQQFLIVRRSEVEGEPRSITIAYGGIIPSVGFNECGIALTGNALVPNDKGFGVPKMHIVREIFRSRHLHETIELCALRPRASSFNNVLTTREGQIYNFEGSATDYDLSFSDTYSVHTNHYISSSMKKYEASQDILNSLFRYNTAEAAVKANLGRFTPEVCKEVLTQHTNATHAPCKHAQGNADQSCTVFSTIIDLTDLKMEACWGNPCNTSWHTYSL